MVAGKGCPVHSCPAGCVFPARCLELDAVIVHCPSWLYSLIKVAHVFYVTYHIQY